MVIKRWCNRKAVKQEKQAVILPLLVDCSTYPRPVDWRQKVKKMLSCYLSFKFSFLLFGEGAKYSQDDQMAMFAWCGTKSWVVTKRMTQCGVAKIDIGLLIGRPSRLKSTSASQEMSRWNLLSCHLLTTLNNPPHHLLLPHPHRVQAGQPFHVGARNFITLPVLPQFK